MLCFIIWLCSQSASKVVIILPKTFITKLSTSSSVVCRRGVDVVEELKDFLGVIKAQGSSHSPPSVPFIPERVLDKLHPLADNLASVRLHLLFVSLGLESRFENRLVWSSTAKSHHYASSVELLWDRRICIDNIQTVGDVGVGQSPIWSWKGSSSCHTTKGEKPAVSIASTVTTVWKSLEPMDIGVMTISSKAVLSMPLRLTPCAIISALVYYFMNVIF